MIIRVTEKVRNRRAPLWMSDSVVKHVERVHVRTYWLLFVIPVFMRERIEAVIA